MSDHSSGWLRVLVLLGIGIFVAGAAVGAGAVLWLL